MVLSRLNEIGILSLAGTGNDIPMWAHYSQNNKGFVIEFDEKHEFFNQSKDSDSLFGRLHKVIYSEKRPDFDSILRINAGDIFLVKSERWKDEMEWRMLQPLKSGSRLEKSGETVLDDDGQPIYLFTLPPACIKGIIFGSRMPQDDRREFSSVLSTDHYSHVKRYQAILNVKKFELNIVPEDEI